MNVKIVDIYLKNRFSPLMKTIQAILADITVVECLVVVLVEVALVAVLVAEALAVAVAEAAVPVADFKV
jgi:hypothetical protein